MSEDVTQVYRALFSHIDRHWPTEEKSDFIWDLGPIKETLPRFRVRRIAPGSIGEPWTYVSMGAWEVLLEGTDRLEFFILSPEETPRHVETLAMVANFHADPRYRLQEGSIIKIGRSWMEGSQATYLLVTLPYTLGPDFEKCQVGSFGVRFLWLVPITESEARFARHHGRMLLEDRLEEADIDAMDPLRPSTVSVDELNSPSDLAQALLRVLHGDLRDFALIQGSIHSDLEKAAGELGDLVLSKAAVRTALEAWRDGRISDVQVQAWASFVRRGYVSGVTGPVRSIDIYYEEAFEDLIASVIARLDELGDIIDGEISDKELTEMLSSLS